MKNSQSKQSFNQSSKLHRPKTVQKQQKQVIQQKLDRILKKDIKILQEKQNQSYNSLQLKNSNDLILEYVSNVYQEYKIINPLPGRRYYFKKPIEQDKQTIKKKTKIILTSNKTQKKFKTPQKSKIQQDHPINIIQDYDNISENIEQQDVALDKSSLNSSSIKAAMKYFDPKHIISPLNNDNTKIKYPIITSFDEQQNLVKKDYQVCQIPQQFRYCIGCNQAILQNNIKHHQLTCIQYKKIKQKSMQEIIQVLSHKINQGQQKIKQLFIKISSEDSHELQNLSKGIIQKSKEIVKKGQFTSQYTEQYDKAVVIAKKWCFITQQINRVNWFLKIRERIKIQLHI